MQVCDKSMKGTASKLRKEKGSKGSDKVLKQRLVQLTATVASIGSIREEKR